MSTGDTDQPHRYDARQHTIATRLNRAHPNWHVTWGLHSRRFWAFPLFDAPPGTVVSAATPDELAAQMHQAEMAQLSTVTGNDDVGVRSRH